MPKLFLKAVAAIVLLFTFATVVLAGGFQLKTIGSLDTAGKLYPEWWYSNENPVLAGTAIPSTEVTLSVDGVTQSATADSTGHWAFNTTNLTAGDHQVTLTNESSTISFTLHIGADAPATAATPSATQPVVGVTEPTMLVLGAGILLLAVGAISRLRFN